MVAHASVSPYLPVAQTGQRNVKTHRVENPFDFKHVTNLKSDLRWWSLALSLRVGMDHFTDDGPCIVMASPGLPHERSHTHSRRIVHTQGFCRMVSVVSSVKCGAATARMVLSSLVHGIPRTPHPRCAGFTVEGTLARHILSEPTHVDQRDVCVWLAWDTVTFCCCCSR